MQKVKFDFEAEKQFIYAPNSTVPIGSPVDENGNIANDGNAIGIVLGYDNVNEKYWTKQMMVVMVGGYVDIIDAQLIWGDEYSAEAKAAMSDIVFCDNHKIGGGGGGGGGWPADLPKPSVGGYGYTEQGEQVLYDGNLLINTPVSQSGTVGNMIDIDQLEVGETYKVVWNGVEYICECVGGEVTYIGNPSIIGAHVETDEPFAFVVGEGEVLVLTSTSGTYSIKLSKSGDTVHKIDEKYLPVTLPAAPSVDNTYTLICTVTDGVPVYRWLKPES